MIQKQYLLAMTAAWVRALPDADSFLRRIEAGHPVSARELAGQAAERASDPRHAAIWFQASADMALLTGDLGGANSAYGRSLHHASGGFASFLTDRAAARKVLGGELLTRQAQAFWRSPSSGMAWDDGMERLAGCALLCHDSAFARSAQRYAQQLAVRANVVGDTDWRCIAAVMAHDFHLQDCIHRLPEVADHAYWILGDMAEEGRVVDAPDYCTAISPCMASRLLAPRLAQLRRLSAAAAGNCMTRIYEDEGECSGAQFAEKNRQADALESAVAALAGRHFLAVRQILSPFQHQDGTLPLCESLQCELLYCLSRLCMLQGRQEESVSLYQRYARIAVSRVRERHSFIRRLAESGGVSLTASDDVSARLPAKYRRAYHWMLSHIAEAGLSVKDVAAVIGVTERALQQTFKRYIGDSPTEVMRRLRMTHIHDALAHEGGGRELIMDVAHRFGVHNRTTLATSYRKYYAKSPSKAI